MKILVATVCSLLASASAAMAQAPPAAAPVVPQAETSGVLPMAPVTARWIYVLDSWTSGARVFDGDTGKMKGLVDVSNLGDIGFDPLGRYYYASETIWSKTDRGIRQDLVSIWDKTTLKLLGEVPVPGRLLGGTTTANFAVSTNGKLAFVYALAPSSSVHVVDLDKRKLQQTVQLPGCAAIFPDGADSLGALCADGTMATISITDGKSKVARTAPFFDAEEDPVFDIIPVDRARERAVFLSYTGKIYTAALGATPKIDAPFSIQVAGGLHPAVAAPLDVNWVPGGSQPLAVDYVNNRLYVLMHVGEQWSHKEPGAEVWVVDLATHKVVQRHSTPGKAMNIQVSQEASPLVYLSGDMKVWVLDGATLESKKTIEHTGGGTLFVWDRS